MPYQSTSSASSTSADEEPSSPSIEVDDLRADLEAKAKQDEIRAEVDAGKKLEATAKPTGKLPALATPPKPLLAIEAPVPPPQGGGLLQAQGGTMAGVGPCVEHPVLFASATGIVYVPGSPEALVGEPSPSSIEVSGSDDRQAQGASPTSVDQADVVAPAKNPPELVDADMDAVSQPVEVVRAEEVMRIDFNKMLRECLRTSEYLEGYKKKSELPPHNSLLNPQMCEADELRFVFKTPSLSRKVADISGGNWEHKDQGYLTALLKMMEAGLRATRKSHLQADGTHVSRSDDDLSLIHISEPTRPY